MKTNRRKIFQIVPDNHKKKLQLRYARILILSQTASLSLVIFLFTLVFTIVLNLDPLTTSEDEVKDLHLLMISLIGLAIAGSVFLTWVLSIRLSHRILGPLFRIETILKQALASNEPPTISIRKDDELQQIVTLLNQVLEQQKWRV
ncbi:MAG: hypothetical protein JW915_03000 [Chitinispirillaceae bacterium]|nr:hypothetical protein [Chitinispirillaceae bacterium]